jgi:hypothetical protein
MYNARLVNGVGIYELPKWTSVIDAWLGDISAWVTVLAYDKYLLKYYNGQDHGAGNKQRIHSHECLYFTITKAVLQKQSCISVCL